MSGIRDLGLYEIPIGEQGFADDPNPHMIAARERHPWLATSAFGLVVIDYDAVNDILAMDDKLGAPADHIVEIMGGAGTNWGRFQVECLIATPGADHARIRSAVNKAFLPRAVNGYHARIRAVVSDLLDEWAPGGAFDFAEFASNFPVAVMFGLTGVPRERITEVKELLEIVGQSFSLDRSLFPGIRDAFDALWSFVDGLIVERGNAIGSRGPDLLDALLAAQIEGRMSPIEIRDLLLFLFVAGYDTSKNQLAHVMNALLDRPEAWRRCADDRSFCDRVVEEVLRHSGVATTYRNVSQTFEYRDVTINAGTMLIFPLGIVGRYSGPFDHGLTFEPERANAKRHTAFGRGMHICLGQFLARLQIAEGLQMMARRLQNPRRAGAVVWRLFPGVWGPKQLPIAFDPA
jgi:cytochrome P450